MGLAAGSNHPPRNNYLGSRGHTADTAAAISYSEALITTQSREMACDRRRGPHADHPYNAEYERLRSVPIALGSARRSSSSEWIVPQGGSYRV